MRIEHIAIYTADMERMREFYEKYFGGTSNTMYHNPRTGLRTYFLTFDDGAQLELMTRPGLDDPEKKEFRTGYTHLSFSVGSKEKVDELTACLKQEGYPVLSGPRTTGDGYYESCVRDPEGNLVEITV